jgi:hypothetical protein
MQLFKYDPTNLSYTKLTSNFKLRAAIVIMSLMLMSFFLGTVLGSVKTERYIAEKDLKDRWSTMLESKYDLSPEHGLAWKDSTFKEYTKRANIYLSRPVFKGTPLKGEIMALCARNAYDSTGVLLPVELALAQAQHESGMGREGKSPKNNPFNIGEHDSGTVKWFNSTFDGTQAYYYYMCRNYLSCRSIDELFGNFVNCSGHRYASSITYEETIRNQYYSNKKWIDNSLKQK